MPLPVLVQKEQADIAGGFRRRPPEYTDSPVVVTMMVHLKGLYLLPG